MLKYAQVCPKVITFARGCSRGLKYPLVCQSAEDAEMFSSLLVLSAITCVSCCAQVCSNVLLVVVAILNDQHFRNWTWYHINFRDMKQLWTPVVFISNLLVMMQANSANSGTNMKIFCITLKYLLRQYPAT